MHEITIETQIDNGGFNLTGAAVRMGRDARSRAGEEMLRYKLTNEKPTRPSKVHFGLLSAEDIKRQSVCEVSQTILYYRGLPASGGLLDPLMGSVDRRHLCATCMHDARTCQGHTGHITLSYPVYHGGYIDTVLRVLRCVCYGCSRVCAGEEEAQALLRAPRAARLQIAQGHLRGKKVCPHCGMPKPIYTRAPLGIHAEWHDDAPWESDEEREACAVPFTPCTALSIMRHIPAEEVEMLGFDAARSHPERMVVQVVPVPPPSTRPAIYSSEGSRSRGQNDLTIRLLEVLKRSHEVRLAIGKTPPIEVACTPVILDKIARLQFEVILLVQPPARVPRPPGVTRVVGGIGSKSLSDRLRGKEGRVRGNLMGKRVDFSARCVITPDSFFECDRVGIPEKIAMALTVPEKVHNLNLASLSARVRRGAFDVRGARNVIQTDGTVVSLTVEQGRNVALRVGDVVERFLEDDDVAVFNRQPSLHMHGMQAHRVRIMPGNTFRLSLPTATPYNADFDGDEMNVHIPQGPAARAECLALMSISQKCITAQSNKPVMGMVQDGLVGLHILTEAGVLLEKAHACRLIGVTVHCARRLPAPCIVTSARRLYTGHQIFSVLLPGGTYVEPADADLERALRERLEDAPVLIRDGELLCGRIRKAHAGSSAGGIVDVLARDFSGVHVMRFLSDAQRMIRAFLLHRGHHVGVADVLMEEEGQRRVHERLEKATKLCEDIEREAAGQGEDERMTAEGAIVRVLGKVLLQVGGIVDEHLQENNSIRTMVRAGSKGSFMNLAQICACLGQQSLEGQRIVSESGKRALPSFRQNDCSLGARGMVPNSFALGLTPTELFFHGIGGREGLVDTAVKTSQTGYLQRRMNKAMEDLSVDVRGHVVTSTGEVVSMRWGSDGFHPARLERNRLRSLMDPSGDDALAPEELRLVREARAAVRAVRTHLLAVGDLDQRVLAPFNVHRTRRLVQRRAAARAEDGITAAEGTAAALELAAAAGSHAVCLALMECVSGASVAGMDRAAHAELCAAIRHKIDDARTVHGESVGCIAAQSVGEPSTQMTLNTFHSAGVATKNVTLGIPRLKELLDCTRNPKTPCVTIRFKRGFRDSERVTEFIAETLPLTRLGDVVTQCETLRVDGELPDNVAWALHLEGVLNGSGAIPGSSKLLVRLDLNQDLMRKRQLTPPMLRRALAARTAGRTCVLSSETSSIEWFLVVRFLDLPAMLAHGGLAPEQEHMLCDRAVRVLMDTVAVSGHPRITTAVAAKGKRMSSRDAAPREEYVVHAYGSCLADVGAAPCIDWARCTSNDIGETLSILGIEACAHVLFDQIKSVVSFDGTYIDDRHISTIVDTMCRAGSLMSLNRHGINRVQSSPLMRASFEETTDILYSAAANAEYENGRCVSTSIMIGQLAHFGTGSVKALFRNAPDASDQTRRRRKRVLTSTRRSFTVASAAPMTEYLVDDVRCVGPLHDAAAQEEDDSPTAAPARKRPRFRPSSPTHE